MKHIFSFLTLSLCFMSTFTCAHIPSNLNNGTPIPSLAPMLNQVTPTVVNVMVEKTVPVAQESNNDSGNDSDVKGVAVGSGVIFDAQHGLIVTNAHVVQGEHLIVVTLKDGRHFRGNLVAKDDGFDIAILQINAQHLSQIHFGDSDQLQVGDFVAAIGSPFGLTQTVTSGVVSALNRNQPQIEGFQSFIQTDAPINPGNSGGALVNLRGNLVGINTAIVTPVDASIGIGFSIPSNMVKNVLTQLLKYGKVKRGMLGVIVQDITPELAQAMHLNTAAGTLVSMVTPGSPAETAGLRTEDVITRINNKPIKSSAQLRNTLGLLAPGTKVTLTIIRAQHEKIISARIGDPSTVQAKHSNPFLTGLRLQNFSELETDGSTITGVLITNVVDTSPASLGGLTSGDIITQANNQPITTIKDLITLANKTKNQLLLQVMRNGRALFLVVQLN